MLLKESSIQINVQALKTLESFISEENIPSISHKALYTGFQHRSKVEFLKFFIV